MATLPFDQRTAALAKSFKHRRTDTSKARVLNRIATLRRPNIAPEVQSEKIDSPVGSAVKKEIGFKESERPDRVKILEKSLGKRTTETSRARARARLLAQGGLREKA